MANWKTDKFFPQKAMMKTGKSVQNSFKDSGDWSKAHNK